MFHHKSFSQRSFTPLSWKFSDTQTTPPVDVIPYSGRLIQGKRREKKRDKDDDVVLFLLR